MVVISPGVASEYAPVVSKFVFRERCKLIEMVKISELMNLLKTGNSDAARKLIAKLKKSGKLQRLLWLLLSWLVGFGGYLTPKLYVWRYQFLVLCFSR